MTNAVRVECYSGYKGDERPTKLEIGEQMLDVAAVEDRWYSPGATYFRVLLANGERYVLRREDAQDPPHILHAHGCPHAIDPLPDAMWYLYYLISAGPTKPAIDFRTPS